MGFRDDNEALRARTKAAERRAQRAETEHERMERELAEAKANDASDAKRIARLEKELAKLKPKPTSRPGDGMRRMLVGVVAAIVIGVAALVYLLAATGKQGERAVPVASQAALPATPEPVAQEPASPLERIRLGGVVRSADGVEGLEAGDGCVADLGLDRDFGGFQVRCGAGDTVRTVFDGATPTGAGMTSVSDQVFEATTVPGMVTRSMSYTLTGQWSGPQAQIQLDPDQHALRVWRQGLEARDVLVHIEYAAGTRGSKVLTSAGTGTIARGTIAKLAVAGEVPSALGDLDSGDCVLRTEPVPRSGAGALTARIVARCGERILYGTGRSGWIPAPANGDIIGPAEDTEMSASDTDPMMTYTGESLTLVEPGWRIVFDIEPHPACTLAEGRWVGTLRDEEGTLRTGVSLTDGELTLPDGTVLMGTEDMRCHEGVARWNADDGTAMLEGHFGPSFATFIGRLGTGPLIELYRE